MKKVWLPNIPKFKQKKMQLKMSITKSESMFPIGHNKQFTDDFIFHQKDTNTSTTTQPTHNTQRTRQKTRYNLYTKKQIITQRDNKQNSVSQTLAFSDFTPTKQQKNPCNNTRKPDTSIQPNPKKKQYIINILEDVVQKPCSLSKFNNYTNINTNNSNNNSNSNNISNSNNNNIQGQNQRKINFKRRDWVKKKVWTNIKKQIKGNSKNQENDFSPWTKGTFTEVISLNTSFNKSRQV